MVVSGAKKCGVGDGDGDGDGEVHLSPIELSERSNMVVSGAKKCGTWARPAEVQDTEAVTGEQEHLGVGGKV